MKRLPLTLGLISTVYWLLAFTVALARSFIYHGEYSSWWDISLLRVPGYLVGERVFVLFETIPGVEYGHILGDSLPIFICFLGSLLAISILFGLLVRGVTCLLYTSPSPRDKRQSRMPSSA